MSLTPADLRPVLDRLEKLERHNRWLRRALATVVVVAGLGLVAGADTGAKKQGDPANLVLRDAQGKERAALVMGTDGPVLRFLDAQGKARGGISLLPGGMALRLVDAGGKLQSGISLQPNGVAIVSYDKNGQLQSGVDALREDTGLLSR